MDRGVNVEDVLGSLKAPLLSQQPEQTILSEDSDETVQKGDFPSLVSAAMALLVVGGVSASAAAMISVSSIAVYVAGGICILDSLWIAVKQNQISKSAGLRQSANQLRDQLTLCQEEGTILAYAINDLKEEADCLHEIQQELEDILSEQGLKVEEAVSIVCENEYILKQMRHNLRLIAMASVTRIVISSDRDGNMVINVKELNELTLRIKLALEEQGIDLNVKAFKAMIRKDNDISHVLKVIEAIMFGEETIDDKDFNEYAEEAQQEEAHQDYLGGSLQVAGSAVARLRRLAGAEEGDVANRATMFTLQDRFTKGSVGVARGTRVTLSKTDQGSSRSNLIRQKSLKNVVHRRKGLARDERNLIAEPPLPG